MAPTEGSGNWISVALAVVLAASALGPLAPPAAGAGPEVGRAEVTFALPGEGRAGDAVPKVPNENTLGFTTSAPGVMDTWRKDTDATPVTFTIDMGPLANKDQLRSDLQEGGYWLKLGMSLLAFFRIDGDGVFDDFRTTDTPPGDEPCHVGRFNIFTLYVNGNQVHTLQGENERPCDVEASRTFDLVPMVQGEPANQFRVKSAWVHDGENTVTIQLHDSGYIHPLRDAFNDGWLLFLTEAQMELVAPPVVISGGWSFSFPPGGHGVGPSGWEGTIMGVLQAKMDEHFGQNPWAWDKAPATEVAISQAGCGQGAGVQSPAKAIYEHVGAVYVGKDGKQDFRVTGCEVAKIIRDAESRLGYKYRAGRDPQGFWYIGFSMGGLIGRWAIQREGLLPSLGKYVSLGTPHWGSHLADAYVLLADAKGWYRELDGDRLCRICLGPIKIWKSWEDNRVQARFYEDNDFKIKPKFLPPFVTYEWEGKGQLLDHRADFELKALNAVLRDLAGDAGAMASKSLAVSGQGGSRAGSLIPGIGLLIEGDGIVPTPSAIFLGSGFDRAFCGAFHSGNSYAGDDACMQPVFEHFTGFRGAAAGAAASAGLAEAGLQAVGLATVARSAHDLVPDLVTGEASAVESVVLEGGNAHFAALWGDEADLVRFTLVSPSGKEYTRASARGLGAQVEVTHEEGLTRAAYFVPGAEPGTWRLVVELTEDAPAWGAAVVLDVAAESALALEADATPRVDPGAAALVTARLTGAGEGVAIEAHALPSDVTLKLHDDGLDGDAVAGDGVFSALYRETEEPGEHVLDVTATGTLGGNAFERNARLVVHSAGLYDLRVHSLTFGAGPVWWGEEARATAVVENLGPGTARGVRVVWTDDSDPARSEPLAAAEDLGDLEPGASRVVEVSWAPSPGPRLVSVEAHGAPFEEALLDNAATLRLDVLATPRTAAFLAGPRGQEGWFTGPVTVTLAPFDGSAPAYQSTSVRVDGGAWQAYAGPFLLSGDALHTLEFFSVDLAGNVEAARSASVGIDALAPAVRIVRPSGGSVNTLGAQQPLPLTMPVVAGLVEVALESGDATSGVARLEAYVDQELVEAFDEPPPSLVWLWDSTATSTGRHTLRILAVDHAGHASSASLLVYVTASRALQVDNSPGATIARFVPPVV